MHVLLVVRTACYPIFTKQKRGFFFNTAAMLVHLASCTMPLRWCCWLIHSGLLDASAQGSNMRLLYGKVITIPSLELLFETLHTVAVAHLVTTSVQWTTDSISLSDEETSSISVSVLAQEMCLNSTKMQGILSISLYPFMKLPVVSVCDRQLSILHAGCNTTGNFSVTEPMVRNSLTGDLHDPAVDCQHNCLPDITECSHIRCIYMLSTKTFM